MTGLTSEQEKGLEAIENLDLARAMQKLSSHMHPGEHWNKRQKELVDKWYRRFLAIIILFPGRVRVPNKIVDEMWHQHLMDTRAYHRDCKAVFGQYLHHDPYFGGTEAEKGAHQAAWLDTNGMFREAFGEDFSAMDKDFHPDDLKAYDCCGDCGDCSN